MSIFEWIYTGKESNVFQDYWNEFILTEIIVIIFLVLSWGSWQTSLTEVKKHLRMNLKNRNKLYILTMEKNLKTNWAVMKKIARTLPSL